MTAFIASQIHGLSEHLGLLPKAHGVRVWETQPPHPFDESSLQTNPGREELMKLFQNDLRVLIAES